MVIKVFEDSVKTFRAAKYDESLFFRNRAAQRFDCNVEVNTWEVQSEAVKKVEATFFIPQWHFH